MLLYQKQSMLATRIWIKSFSEYVHIYKYIYICVCIHIHIYMGASMSNIYSIKNQTISNYSSWVRRGASLPPGHLHQAVYKCNRIFLWSALCWVSVNNNRRALDWVCIENIFLYRQIVTTASAHTSVTLFRSGERRKKKEQTTTLCTRQIIKKCVLNTTILMLKQHKNTKICLSMHTCIENIFLYRQIVTTASAHTSVTLSTKITSHSKLIHVSAYICK